MAVCQTLYPLAQYPEMSRADNRGVEILPPTAGGKIVKDFYLTNKNCLLFTSAQSKSW